MTKQLQKKKDRSTQQRRLIYEELRAVNTHPTASEIYEIVRRKLPNVSMGTVYRNLEYLCEKGEIQKLEMAGTQRRFDAITENHYHIRCIDCGRVDDLESITMDNLEGRIRENSDYKVVGHRLEFTGLCPKCKHKH
jgi:Fur family ferric uptake transcriptional regulator